MGPWPPNPTARGRREGGERLEKITGEVNRAQHSANEQQNSEPY